MKIQLVFAPPRERARYEVLSENLWPPLGVLYLASSVRKKIPEVQVKVTDGCQLGYAATLAQIQEFRPQILGISFYTTTANGAICLAREIKRTLPTTVVVMGGPHATALPSDTLRESKADVVLVGEGESSFPQLVQRVMENGGNGSVRLWEKIAGACYYSEDTERPIRQNPPAKFVARLDDIAFPAWDLVDFHNYKGWYLSKQSPEAPILSSRGCPFCCTFCSNAVWKSSNPAWRHRSACNVVDEIELLHRVHGINEFFDQADEFNTSVNVAMEICHEIKRRKMPITWKAQLRARPFTEDLAKAMAEAGCWYVHLGVESGNQETLDGVGKKTTLQEVESTCRWLCKYNIRVLALFMIYNAGEKDGKLFFEDTKKSENTLEYAHRLVKKGLINYISWSVTTPYPGSKLYDIGLRHQLITPALLKDWEAWQTTELFPMKLPGVHRRNQGTLKRKGEWLRAKCLLKNGNFKYKDFFFLVKRGMHVLFSSGEN